MDYQTIGALVVFGMLGGGVFVVMLHLFGVGSHEPPPAPKNERRHDD